MTPTQRQQESNAVRKERSINGEFRGQDQLRRKPGNLCIPSSAAPEKRVYLTGDKDFGYFCSNNVSLTHDIATINQSCWLDK
ncbi:MULTISPECIES: hypothetical protein [unclassified Coleofasciculus]|uniref:hypothetical protein n=1 Tax=unclassified Coleofasciculus TaxID=2692782 RepID=UPI001882A0A4|nr:MULTISPECIES: hypothetical protein [unclassified Coleofasciculus]MBE9126444.1 hypothetical protein [Coleofasciculus sp. LEGE 07081]MBE9148046.1 hypothetical protein [Coleofasciculus sp. LEGE 07092]